MQKSYVLRMTFLVIYSTFYKGERVTMHVVTSRESWTLNSICLRNELCYAMLALLSEVSKTFLLIILKMFSLFQRVLWYHQQRTDWWRCDQCPHHRSSSCLVSRKVWNGPTWRETRKFGLLPTDKKVWIGHTWRDPRKFGLVPLGGIPESLD